MMLQWSPQQAEALSAVSKWLKAKDPSKQIFRLFGFAGTGKTSLSKYFADDVKGRVCYAAFTGKAASVMRKKGCDGASTIHSLIYTPVDEGNGITRFVLKHDSPIAGAALVIIDEASMVGDDLAKDLLSFGTPVLVLGDPAQLPPVKGAGFFTDAEPDILLTEIHRQAQENPIIRLSMDVREGRRISVGDYGAARVIERADLDQKWVMDAGIVLVGMNRTRRLYNARIRELKGFKSTLPIPGDQLVCLRNKRMKNLLNGTLWTVENVKRSKGDFCKLVISPEDGADTKAHVEVEVHKAFFEGGEDDLDLDILKRTEQFTYGYALTVHKSQGSQWDDVMLFDESAVFKEERARHLYTGITRAAEKITIVLGS
jgi:exodeoxyribonuclease-5